MDRVEELLRKRKWCETCLRANIADPDAVQQRGQLKVVRLRSNVVKSNKEPELYDAIRAIAPEWWGDETRITVNQDVCCKRHRDGNTGHSWMLWLGDYTSGGQLHFDDGRVIDGKREWHKFNGRTHHWNTPHLGGTKYSIILYRRSLPTKSSLVHKRKKQNSEVPPAPSTPVPEPCTGVC